MRFLKTTGKVLLFLSLALGLGTWYWLRSLRPDYSTTLTLSELKAPVEVLYDDYGVPHIYAQNEEDMYQAFGFVHAQDRLFQMEVLRRLADGRLAEVFGEKALSSDRFFRTLSFRQQAKLTIDSLYNTQPDAPFVRAAKAYMKGVNQYIKQGKTPIEFTLAGIPKTEFTLEDMEIIVGYMGYTFVDAFRSEAIATLIQEKYGTAYLQDIMANWPAGEPRISTQAQETSTAQVTAAQALGHMANQLTTMESSLPAPPYHGSNGWAISGSKTKSGKPILSNDTHIAFAQPSVWYEAHLECPGFQFYGSFLAGTPTAAMGHSQHGGWGLTMFENDDADFFREKINPKDSNQVWSKGGWVPLQVREETIKVKDQPDQTLLVKRSPHGFLMNESMENLAKETQPVALWWVYHQFPSHHLESFYGLAHARDASEAGAAVSKLTAPGLNVMWADTAGNIAWWAAGKIPVRPAHVNPMLILDGASGADDPLGWLDFSQNPQILNPESGVLFTANNQPDDMGSGLVAGYYVPGNRANRIGQLLLTDKADWTEADVRKVINDVTSPSYVKTLQEILPVMQVEKLSPSAKNALQKLSAWKGEHLLSSVEPTIYYRLMYHVMKNLVRDELGKELFLAFEHNTNFKRNLAALLANDASPWWDNVLTPKTKETRKEILTLSLNEALTDLETQLGADPATWRWERVHTLEHKHPLGILPLVGRFFNVGPFPAPGGRETINNLDFYVDSTGNYPVVYGPALRRIVDFGNWEQARSVLPTGQSGYFFSKHYADQAELFVEGGSRPERMNRADVEKVMQGKLVLNP
ncbi:penicillin acylase family protein [Arundinibacter roseus]|uniref:Penicillin acylase family protein n=1 Tax=Arundinibacter roseus TaxID=2070510 RepID=A0A4R4K4E6_9BACT|nr:penicillin acylase family protein [Arundinibacter roseus]TDB62277.1 penicillin acylase family protein [Arundinibacter roseus]